MTARPKTVLAVSAVAISLLLTGCQSAVSGGNGVPIDGSAPVVHLRLSVPRPDAVQLPAKRAALHLYQGSFGGPISGSALGSQRPCPGTLFNGLVLMLGKTQVAAVFICQVTEPGTSAPHYTGAFRQVPANRIDALLAVLSPDSVLPGVGHSCTTSEVRIDVPLVVLESRNGTDYDVRLPPGECPGTVPDNVTKAIDAALAPVTEHSVPGVRGYSAGPLDLGTKCNSPLPVHNGPLIAVPISAITAVYVCPPAPSVTRNTTRYYKTVPEPKTVGLLSALAGKDDHPGGPFRYCPFIAYDSGYLVVAQSSDGSLWRVRMPTAGCGFPTIAVGKAIDAALGTHRYDAVKGYGL